jgi:hypothetical protein
MDDANGNSAVWRVPINPNTQMPGKSILRSIALLITPAAYGGGK